MFAIFAEVPTPAPAALTPARKKGRAIANATAQAQVAKPKGGSRMRWAKPTMSPPLPELITSAPAPPVLRIVETSTGRVTYYAIPAHLQPSKRPRGRLRRRRTT
jgi:hypothetical protein